MKILKWRVEQKQFKTVKKKMQSSSHQSRFQKPGIILTKKNAISPRGLLRTCMDQKTMMLPENSIAIHPRRPETQNNCVVVIIILINSSQQNASETPPNPSTG
jgi:hypothetical protein